MELGMQVDKHIIDSQSNESPGMQPDRQTGRQVVKQMENHTVSHFMDETNRQRHIGWHSGKQTSSQLNELTKKQTERQKILKVPEFLCCIFLTALACFQWVEMWLLGQRRDV